ncbi:MAG: hypothetical protein ACRDV4_07160 [Acidimicrobiales bacterium]
MANALRDTLVIASLNLEGDQPLESDYLFVWLGRLGATAMWLLLWCNRLTQMTCGTTVRVETDDLAATLGVKRQVVAQAFNRLVRFRFAQASSGGYLVRGGLPVMAPAQVERLSASARGLDFLGVRSADDPRQRDPRYAQWKRTGMLTV